MFMCVGKTLTDVCRNPHETLEEAQKCLAAHQAQLRLREQVSNRVISEVESIDDLEEQY